MTIEDTFGILTAKWQILHKPLFFNIKTSVNIVKCLTCLHNFLIKTEKTKPAEERLYLNEELLKEMRQNVNTTLDEEEDDDIDDENAFSDTDSFDDIDDVEENDQRSTSVHGKEVRNKLAMYFLTEMEPE